MATKKKEAAPQAPVSLEANIEVHVFETPQNDMLGFVMASDSPKGKFIKIAHAYLMDSGPEISLMKLGGVKASFEDIERLQRILTLFTDQVKAFYAARAK